jgi:1-acyl-sn-glycerol-3-phosphate acyltransferase
MESVIEHESAAQQEAEAGRRTGPVAGALRIAYLAGACVVGAARVELAYRRGGRAGAARKFQQIAGEFCEIFGVKVELQGRLDPQAREVRVANHTSYLDIFALNAVGAGRFLSMAPVRRWPLVGRVGQHIGTVFIDRDSSDGRASGLKSLHRAVQDGGPPVVVFPEGRTGLTGVRPFARGAFSAARAAGVRARPLALVYDDREAVAWVDDMELLPHVWRRLCGGEVRCVIRPLAPVGGDDSTAEESAEQARRQIARELAAHQPS